MWGRVLATAAVLLVLGVGGGYAIGTVRTDEPGTIHTATPVPAQSPAAPTQAAVTCAEDPSAAPLASGLAMTPDHVSTGGKHGYPLSLDRPTGWNKFRSNQTAWKWTPVGASPNTYLLRVTLVAALNQAPDVIEQGRLTAYQSAVVNHDLADFQLESDSGDSFSARYSDQGFCRLTMERVLALGGGSAYVDVAVTGRLSDGPGLADLLDRTTASMQPN